MNVVADAVFEYADDRFTVLLTACTRYVYVVDGASALSLYPVAFAASVASGAKFVHPPPVQRSTLNPVSSDELSAHARLMLDVDVADALSAEGAAGAVGGGGGGVPPQFASRKEPMLVFHPELLLPR